MTANHNTMNQITTIGGGGGQRKTTGSTGKATPP